LSETLRMSAWELGMIEATLKGLRRNRFKKSALIKAWTGKFRAESNRWFQHGKCSERKVAAPGKMARSPVIVRDSCGKSCHAGPRVLFSASHNRGMQP